MRNIGLPTCIECKRRNELRDYEHVSLMLVSLMLDDQLVMVEVVRVIRVGW